MHIWEKYLFLTMTFLTTYQTASSRCNGLFLAIGIRLQKYMVSNDSQYKSKIRTHHTVSALSWIRHLSLNRFSGCEDDDGRGGYICRVLASTAHILPRI